MQQLVFIGQRMDEAMIGACLLLDDELVDDESAWSSLPNPFPRPPTESDEVDAAPA